MIVAQGMLKTDCNALQCLSGVQENTIIPLHGNTYLIKMECLACWERASQAKRTHVGEGIVVFEVVIHFECSMHTKPCHQ